MSESTPALAISGLTSRIFPCSDHLVHQLEDQISDIGIPAKMLGENGSRQHVPDYRRFFPNRSLREIFSTEVIDKILGHECSSCSAHLSDDPLAHPNQFNAGIVLQNPDTLNLFALLVYIRYPLLIGRFLISDTSKSPKLISSDRLKDLFSYFDNRTLKKLIMKFENRKFQFSAPSFDHENYVRYDNEVIIPYLNEIPKGRGGFGRVDEVWIHADYCDFNVPTDSGELDGQALSYKRLARKEMMSEFVSDFLKEKENLERVRGLGDLNHVMQIQKTYQHGRKFNLLFRLAKTDLHQYLRAPEQSTQDGTRIKVNNIWTQVYGVAAALEQIINYKVPGKPEQAMLGWHLDLTPRNILVGYDGVTTDNTFRISDLGQAQFALLGTGSDTPFRGGQRTHFIDGGGTDAYSPPEYRERRCDAKYDVFSLGVIVLETLTFTLRGPDGLLHKTTGLDSIRRTNDGGHWNQRVYTDIPLRKLKPEILEFMSGLKDGNLEDDDNMTFVHDLVDLIHQMLEPDRTKRIAINDVLRRMEQIFSTRVERPFPQVQKLIHNDEQVLVDFVETHHRNPFTQPKVPSLILENSKGMLRIFLDATKPPQNCSRRDLQLMFDFSQDKSTSADRYDYSIVSMGPGHLSQCMGKYKIFGAEPARILHSKLIGHRVSHRFGLESVTIEKHCPRTYKNPLLYWFRTRPNHQITLTGLWLEVWVEKSAHKHEEANKVPDRNSSVQGPRAKRHVDPGSRVPAGRVVLYCNDCFLIIPFGRESRLAKVNSGKDVEDPYFIRFEPMDRRQRKYFTVSRLQDKTCEPPGIPMSHGRLRQVEELGQMECNYIEIKVTVGNYPYTVKDVIRNEKSIWHTQVKAQEDRRETWLPDD